MRSKSAGLPRCLTFLAMALGLTVPVVARADQEQTSFSVLAQVLSVVEVNAAVIDFGAFPKLAEVTANGNIIVSATPNMSYQIVLGPGRMFGSDGRHMTSDMPGSSLAYELYSDPGFTTVWADGSFAGSSSVSDIGDGTPQSHPVYGRVFAGQSPNSGSYSDLIQVTVLF